MLLKIFGQNSFINSIVLLILIVILTFIGTRESIVLIDIEHVSYFQDQILGLRTNYEGLSIVLSILIMFFSAIYINRMVIINKLGNTISLIPGLLFILFAYMIQGGFYLNVILISVFFLLLSMTFLNYSFKIRNSVSNVFSTGLWLGVAVLFYPPVILYFLAMIIGFRILRRFRTEEFYRFVIGVLVPLFLASVYAFLQDEFTFFIRRTFVESHGLFRVPQQFETKELIIFALLLGMVIISVFSVFSYTTKKPVPSQHMISIQYWYMVFSGISVLFVEELYFHHLLLLVIPLSIFMSESITSMKNKKIAELTLWFILILSVILQFELIS